MLSFVISLKAQVSINGLVLDKSNKQALAYASIGIIGKPLGTISNEAGEFALTLSQKNNTDSLKIFSIGYLPKVVLVSEYITHPIKPIELEAAPVQLEEVVVHSKKVKFKKLGANTYSKNNCTGFADATNNWKGSEAAVLIRNSKNVLIESFSFYVIQNKYSDSLLFRLMFYKKIKNDWVGPTFLKKPIIFKLGIKQGEFTLDLKEYNIRCNADFFVSLECLMDKMEITKFCYSGSIDIPSYYKVKAFSKWHSTTGTRNGGGGADYNVKVSYAVD